MCPRLRMCSTQGYHLYYFPIKGTVKEYRSLPGDYYEVDRVALRSNVDILTRNARGYVLTETEGFGNVLFVDIEATAVGSVEIRKKWHEKGAKIKKGEEVGIFQFGGSSIMWRLRKAELSLIKICESTVRGAYRLMLR